MKTDLYLQIPKPCHENWDAMTTVDKGKFCASCSKEVVDFSMMSDAEVLNFFKHSTGKTCGKFSADQLQRPLQETKIEKKKGWKWAMAGIASLIMTSKSQAQKKEDCTAILGKIKIEEPKKETVKKNSQARKPLPVKNIKKVVTLNLPIDIMGDVSFVVFPDGDTKVKGIVVDENDHPLKYVMVRTANNSARVYTDAYGYFEVSQNRKDNSTTLLFSNFGFIEECRDVDLTKEILPLRVIMKPAVAVLPEVTVISYRSKTRRDIMGETVVYPPVAKKDTTAVLIRKIVDTIASVRILNDPLSIFISQVKIYPNPALKNSTIHIAIKDAGSYQVHLLDNTSRLLHTEKTTTQVKQQAINIQLPTGMASGLYYIRVTNMLTKKSYVEKLIVE